MIFALVWSSGDESTHSNIPLQVHLFITLRERFQSVLRTFPVSRTDLLFTAEGLTAPSVDYGVVCERVLTVSSVLLLQPFAVT